MSQPTTSGRLTPETLYDLTFVSDAQIAPDGQRVAFVRTTIDRQASAYRARIWVVPVAGGDAVCFTTGAERDAYPRWSPDGRWLAFIAKRGERNQLWALSTAGGEAMPLTATRNGVLEFAWSPDSRRLAFVTKTGPADAAEDAAKASGEPVSDERVVTRLRHKADGEGFFDDRQKHLWLVDLPGAGSTAAPAARQLTDGAWDDSSPAWSPDGTRLAFTSNRPNTDDMAAFTDLYVLAVGAAGAGLPEPRRLTGSVGPMGQPAWSPDGSLIACLGNTNPEPYRRTAITRLYAVRADGTGEPRCLTPDLDRPLNTIAATDARVAGPEQPPVWSPDGRAIYVLVGDHGNSHVHRVDAERAVAEPVVTGERTVFGCSLSADGARLAFAAADLLNPGDVYAARADGSEERQLTRVNEAVLARLELSRPERFTVRRNDGYEIEGWAMRPVGAVPGRRYPAVLEIHGGPHAQYGTTFFIEFQVLAANGIGVIFTNPRGSEGYGQDFVFANHDDWGGEDMRDLFACVDHCVEQGWADSARLGVAGGSFGGFMTNWIIGQDTRFRAAVSDRSICNFVSKWGVSDIGWIGNDWEWGGPPYDDFERYLRASPIYYVKRITTPLLLLHGEQDLRCPVAEAEQFFSALKRLGKTVELVRFPGESHELSRSGKPVRRVKRLHYIRDWFTKYLLE